MQCCKASYTRSTLLSVPVRSKTMHQHTQNPAQWFSGFSVYPQPSCRYYWHWSQMPSRKPHKTTMWLWDRSHGDVPLWIEHNEDDHKCPLMFKHSVLIHTEDHVESCDLCIISVKVALALNSLQLTLCMCCIFHSLFFKQIHLLVSRGQ